MKHHDVAGSKSSRLPLHCPAAGSDPARVHAAGGSSSREFLLAYRPTGVDDAVWLPVREAAAELVLRAGAPRRLRVEKDIQALGAVAAHQVQRGRPVTLDEMLSDTTLLSYDSQLVASRKTRENKRGILRRLQAAHHEVPWRQSRRCDGERLSSLVPAHRLRDLHRVERRAQGVLAAPNPTTAPRERTEATHFLEALEAARRDRRRGASCSTSALTATFPGWASGRAFADRNGLRLTIPIMRALATHEVLVEPLPVTVLIARFGLSRRDLDLALTAAADLPDRPATSAGELLRGR